jgi:hypothetical protein
MTTDQRYSTNKLYDYRRKKELDFITRNIKKPAVTKYVVSDAWINKYTEWMNSKRKEHPGPIDNAALAKTYTPKTKGNIYAVNE